MNNTFIYFIKIFIGKIVIKRMRSLSIFFFDNQELLNIIFQYIDTQLLLKKIKCLSKCFNRKISSDFSLFLRVLN